MSFETYLPRFAAARLVSWWETLPERWTTDSALGIGLLRMRLRGRAEPKPRLVAQCERAVAALREQMLGGMHDAA